MKSILIGVVIGIIFIIVYELIFQTSLNKLKQKEKTFLYWVSHIIYIISCGCTFAACYFSSKDYSFSEIPFYVMPVVTYVLYTIPAVIVLKIYIRIQNKRENDRFIRESTNQKKINNDIQPPIFFVASVVTVIAIFLFIYFEFQLLFNPITKSDKSGIHVLNFFMCFALPIILWIAYAVISKNDLNNKLTSEVDEEMKKIYGSNYGQTTTQKKASDERIRTEARKRLREAKSDFEEGFITHAEYKKILDENKPKIL